MKTWKLAFWKDNNQKIAAWKIVGKFMGNLPMDLPTIISWSREARVNDSSTSMYKHS